MRRRESRLKTVVDRIKDNGEAVLNSRFIDFANHYGFQIRLCKPYSPRTKGKVERPIRYIRENFLARKSTVLEELGESNDLLSDWVENTANKRVHGTTHEIPDERFARERKELLPLSAVTPFDVAIYEQRKVGRDCFVSYQTNRYSVPHKYAGQSVTLRITPTEIFIIHEEKNIAQYGLLKGQHKTIINHQHLEELKKLRQLKTETPGKKKPDSLQNAPEVYTRSLEAYEQFASGGGQ
jgi:hypothetical protein